MITWDLLQANRWGSALLLLIGLSIAAHGLRGMAQPLRRRVDEWAWITGFRRAVIGLALVGIGLAWLTWQGWVLAIALGVGGEELLESSGIIAALRERRAAVRQ